MVAGVIRDALGPFGPSSDSNIIFLVRKILPFPVRYDVYHDIWIGMRNEMSGGSTHYIAEPLVRYRRHEANLSGGLSAWRRVKVRVHLLTALLVDALRRVARG